MTKLTGTAPGRERRPTVFRLRALAESIATWALTWRTALYARREQRRRDAHKQHWQAAQVGGGAVIQLGYMTQAEAIARVQLLKGKDEPIAYVDFERGFIAHGRHPAELK